MSDGETLMSDGETSMSEQTGGAGNLASVSLSVLDRLAGSVREMVTFVPGGENVVKAWYEYWGVLRRSHSHAVEQIEGERRKVNTRLSTYDKALGYAKRFAALETPASRNSGPFLSTPPEAECAPEGPATSQECLPQASGSIPLTGELGSHFTDSLADEVDKRLAGAEESIIRPILSRLAEVPALILTLVRGINAEDPPPVALHTRRLPMDDEGAVCFVTTLLRPDPLLSVRLCVALTGLIPWEYDFFTDDVASFESPDGLVWFYPEISARGLEYAANHQIFKATSIPETRNVTPVRSMIPVLPPDGEPGYRLINSGGFASVEFHRDGYFDSRLGEEEFSRFSGFLVYLDSKGIIDLTISQS